MFSQKYIFVRDLQNGHFGKRLKQQKSQKDKIAYTTYENFSKLYSCKYDLQFCTLQVGTNNPQKFQKSAATFISEKQRLNISLAGIHPNCWYTFKYNVNTYLTVFGRYNGISLLVLWDLLTGIMGFSDVLR